jgi:hypothetical protein
MGLAGSFRSNGLVEGVFLPRWISTSDHDISLSGNASNEGKSHNQVRKSGMCYSSGQFALLIVAGLQFELFSKQLFIRLKIGVV